MTTRQDRKNPRSRLPKGEGDKLRTEIMTAAEELMTALGTADKVSVRAISERVGVTPPAIYIHFTDKQELLFAACARRCELLHSRLADAFAASEDPVESLRAGAEAYVRFGLDHPEQYRMVFMTRQGKAEGGVELDDVPGISAFYLLVRAIQRCIEDELLRDDIDAFSASVSLWVALHGLTAALISHPEFPFLPLERTIDDLSEVALKGLLRR